MPTDFDDFTGNYADVITKGAAASGETYEYFIKIRIERLTAKLSDDRVKLTGPRILDFGCGIGVTEIYLQQKFPDAEIYGIDSSNESIRAANSLALANVTFTVVNGDNMPFQDNYFDLIYSNGTFHHMEHSCHLATLQQLHRILRPGGELFIFENNPFNPLMMQAMKKTPFDRNAQVVYPGYLQKSVQEAGFTVRALNYYFFFPQMLKYLRITEKLLCRVPFGAQYFVWARKH